MTLEQKLWASIRAGDLAVIEAMLLGIFGHDAQLWLAREILGTPEQEPDSLPDCLDQDPPWVTH